MEGNKPKSLGFVSCNGKHTYRLLALTKHCKWNYYRVGKLPPVAPITLLFCSLKREFFIPFKARLYKWESNNVSLLKPPRITDRIPP